MSSFQVFNPRQDVVIRNRKLPHWSQAGTICFITFRTWDSMPKPVLDGWIANRCRWLRSHGIDPSASDWKHKLERLDRVLRQEFRKTLSDRWHERLDACHGACVLRGTDLSRIVANSFRHFDGDRYDLSDFVVMPNHAHLLVAFPHEEAMLGQCQSWKQYTAARVNRRLGRKGRFWQQDGYDHLVRSPEQFEYLQRYIADNPRRAKLSDQQFVHFSKK